ncbi:MAG: hypothetical protein QNJ35_13330 [Paracoccaceae bacterium]|nr:hypothetical protein [Paracoccaceae bacterium]
MAALEDEALEARLLAAHARADTEELIAGYTRAAEHAKMAGDTDKACFFLTHAWVFALEAGDPRAAQLRARLMSEGRV